MRPTVATIGTTHPLGVAGLGLCVRVAGRLKVRPVYVIAGVTAQDARGVTLRTPLDAATIAAQFAALAAADVRAIHIGALLDANSVAAVADGLAHLPDVAIVYDPVLAASTGEDLADEQTLAAIRTRLLGRCALLTPNLAEAARFLDRPLGPEAAADAAALRLLGPSGVLLKGGHRVGRPRDVLATESGTTEFSARRIRGELRGTGDLLAFAIAAHLARGRTLRAAIEAARRFVRVEIERAVDFAGMRVAR